MGWFPWHQYEKNQFSQGNFRERILKRVVQIDTIFGTVNENKKNKKWWKIRNRRSQGNEAGRTIVFIENALVEISYYDLIYPCLE